MLITIQEPARVIVSIFVPYIAALLVNRAAPPPRCGPGFENIDIAIPGRTQERERKGGTDEFHKSQVHEVRIDSSIAKLAHVTTRGGAAMKRPSQREQEVRITYLEYLAVSTCYQRARKRLKENKNRWLSPYTPADCCAQCWILLPHSHSLCVYSCSL